MAGPFPADRLFCELSLEAVKIAAASSSPLFL
jgi:hypothetical protein